MSPPIFVSWDKKYRKYLRYILQSAKKAKKNRGIFCRAQKQTKKIYDNCKYLRYILRIAKISANISNIFCKLQKILLKMPQKKTEKNLWLLYGLYRSSNVLFYTWCFVARHICHKFTHFPSVKFPRLKMCECKKMTNLRFANKQYYKMTFNKTTIRSIN